MYRTYLRIPSNERPELPDKGTGDWKLVMRGIWDERQKQLKEAMDKIADLPTVLEELIGKLKGGVEVQGTLDELSYLLTDIGEGRRREATTANRELP